MPEEMWDIESKRHNKELELWEYWRYFEDLEGELVRTLFYPRSGCTPRPRKGLTPDRDSVGEPVFSSWE